MKSQSVRVLQATASDVAELGATDGAVAFTSDSDLADLGGEDDVDAGRCDVALPWSSVYYQRARFCECAATQCSLRAVDAVH